MSPAGDAPVFSTYLGGSVFEEAFGIAVDSAGNIYVAGHALSEDFPTTPGVFQPDFLGGGPGRFESDGFVVKLDPSVCCDASLVYSTFLGGTEQDTPLGLALDALGNAYVTGITNSSDFPTTAGAFQTVFRGGFSDVFITEIVPAALRLEPASLTFADRAVGATSDPQTVSVTNVTGGAVIIETILASGDFAATEDCGTSVAAGASCTISVTFTPTGTGARTGEVTITSNAPESPHTIALSGTGPNFRCLLRQRQPRCRQGSRQPIC